MEAIQGYIVLVCMSAELVQYEGEHPQKGRSLTSKAPGRAVSPTSFANFFEALTFESLIPLTSYPYPKANINDPVMLGSWDNAAAPEECHELIEVGLQLIRVC
jgi:hypothetical protein